MKTKIYDLNKGAPSRALKVFPGNAMQEAIKWAEKNCKGKHVVYCIEKRLR